MARGTTITSPSLGRGLNTQASPYELQPGETPDCLNVRGTIRGAIRKRQGMLDLSDGTSFATQPRKIAVYRSGATTKVVGMGTRLQALEPGAAPSAAYTPTTTQPYSWASAIGQQVSGQGPLFMMSDADKVYYDGAAFGAWTAASGSIPTGRILCPHFNRLYVADVSSIADARSAMVFSEIGDYRTWPPDQIVKFDPFQQDRITAMCSLGTYLMVFKRDGIWRVYDPDTGANQKITSQAGTVFRDSVVVTDRGAFFLDPDRGVMVTDGQTVKALSDQILPEIRNLPLDDESTFNVSAAYWEGSYFLSIPDSTGMPLYVFEYDLDEKAWWRHDCAAYDLQVAAFGQSSDPLLVREALVGAVPAAVLQRLGVTASATTYRLLQLFRQRHTQDQVRGEDPAPVQFRWRSSPAVLDGNPAVSKRLAELRVDALGNGDVLQLRDFPAVPETVGALSASGGSEDGRWGVARAGLWGTPRPPAIWGGTAAVTQSRFHTLGVAREVQLQVQGTSQSDFELHSYSWFIGPRRRTD